ncbi:radical SAM protein [Paenibacillus sp. SI8]|uniref:radical SAM protein n=1 Tax=unclassified Paenibacillus TaxID=185978 RepID=UPI003467D749
MLKFYTKMVRTFDDLPGYTSLLIHSLAGCNLHCCGCHNYAELVAADHDFFLTSTDIIEQIKKNGYLFDAIIISGGEFLMGNLTEICEFLSLLKTVFAKTIIINTNGTFPEKINALLANDWVDGIHIDMKMPYHCFEQKRDTAIYQTVLGIVPTKELIRNMLESLHTVIKHNSPVSQVRTVKYPVLSGDYFEQIEHYVNFLNRCYNSKVPYQLNEFYSEREMHDV